MNAAHSISEIATRYKGYTSDIKECFEDYLFQSFYLPHAHNLIKRNQVPLMRMETPHSNGDMGVSKDILYGIISRLREKAIGERALVQAVAETEDFLQDVVYRVYCDIPEKLTTDIETPDQQLKVLKVILDSDDKDEIISRIAEEKIRGVFYGNPVDFFAKDKARVALGAYIKDNFAKALNEYAEIIARRNVLSHNGGRVDRKYLREVKDSTFRLNQKVTVTKEYLKSSIRLMHGLASLVTAQVYRSIYNAGEPRGRLKSYVKSFDTAYKGK